MLKRKSDEIDTVVEGKKKTKSPLYKLSPKFEDLNVYSIANGIDHVKLESESTEGDIYHDKYNRELNYNVTFREDLVVALHASEVFIPRMIWKEFAEFMEGYKYNNKAVIDNLDFFQYKRLAEVVNINIVNGLLEMGAIIAGGIVVYVLNNHVDEDCVGDCDVFIPNANVELYNKCIQYIDEKIVGPKTYILIGKILSIGAVGSKIPFQVILSEGDVYDIISTFHSDYVQCALYSGKGTPHGQCPYIYETDVISTFHSDYVQCAADRFFDTGKMQAFKKLMPSIRYMKTYMAHEAHETRVVRHIRNDTYSEKKMVDILHKIYNKRFRLPSGFNTIFSLNIAVDHESAIELRQERHFQTSYGENNVDFNDFKKDNSDNAHKTRVLCDWEKFFLKHFSFEIISCFNVESTAQIDDIPMFRQDNYDDRLRSCVMRNKFRYVSLDSMLKQRDINIKYGATEYQVGKPAIEFALANKSEFIHLGAKEILSKNVKSVFPRTTKDFLSYVLKLQII